MTITRVLLTLVGIIFVVGAIAFVKGLQISALIESGKAMQEPPTTISSSIVEAHEWETTLQAIGSLEAAKGLEVTADLSGRINRILFEAGSEVEAGDLLVEQDISVEKAQLRSATSAAALAKSNFTRIRQLYERKVASKSEFDNAKNTYQSALADVDNINASIEKKSIRAPFNGRLGIRLVNLGQTISAGEPVVSLQATDQMFVNFFLPQQNLPLLASGLTIRLTSDAVPDTVFTGTINAINPEIDSDTRSVEIQAILSNPDNTLLPGMFASIDVMLPDVQRVLLVPITAVSYSTYGDSVFVIEEKIDDASEAVPDSDSHTAGSNNSLSKPTEKDTAVASLDNVSDTENADRQPSLIARQQFVRLGEARGDFVVVTKGLSEGEQIVNAGVFKLRNGASVVINNKVVPEFNLAPTLQDQ
ncbi:efflux RND transporter periplasmic adaptor subunit [Eionea flava]